eukprot:4354845-Amphidinium_carterae.2
MNQCAQPFEREVPPSDHAASGQSAYSAEETKETTTNHRFVSIPTRQTQTKDDMSLSVCVCALQLWHHVALQCLGELQICDVFL